MKKTYTDLIWSKCDLGIDIKGKKHDIKELLDKYQEQYRSIINLDGLTTSEELGFDEPPEGYANELKEKRFTIKEFKTYLESQDSLGDIHYNLTEENVIEANNPEPCPRCKGACVVSGQGADVCCPMCHGIGY